MLTGDLLLQPHVERRSAKTPKFANVHTGDLVIACHFLERLWMDFEQRGSFVAIEKLLEFWSVSRNPVRRLLLQRGHSSLRILQRRFFKCYSVLISNFHTGQSLLRATAAPKKPTSQSSIELRIDRELGEVGFSDPKKENPTDPAADLPEG